MDFLEKKEREKIEKKEKANERYINKNWKSGYITKTEADKHHKLIALETHPLGFRRIGFLYHDIFSYDEKYFNSGLVYIIAGCSFAPSITGIISTKKIPKKVCPCCSYQTLTPYYCLVYTLTGSHIIKFYCENCKEKIAFNNIYDYYKLLKKYLIKYGLWYHTASTDDFSFERWRSFNMGKAKELNKIREIEKDLNFSLEFLE